MHRSLVTPTEIEQLAEQVLTQLHGLPYVKAMYALEVAQQRLSGEVERLTDEHVFDPKAPQGCPATRRTVGVMLESWDRSSPIPGSISPPASDPPCDADDSRAVAVIQYPNGTAQLEIEGCKPWLLSAAEMAKFRTLLAAPSAKRGPL